MISKRGWWAIKNEFMCRSMIRHRFGTRWRQVRLTGCHTNIDDSRVTSTAIDFVGYWNRKDIQRFVKGCLPPGIWFLNPQERKKRCIKHGEKYFGQARTDDISSPSIFTNWKKMLLQLSIQKWRNSATDLPRQLSNQCHYLPSKNESK